jgi:hypothetical protein
MGDVGPKQKGKWDLTLVLPRHVAAATIPVIREMNRSSQPLARHASNQGRMHARTS